MGLPIKEKFGTAITFRCKLFIQTSEDSMRAGFLPVTSCACVMILNGWINPKDIEDDEPAF